MKGFGLDLINIELEHNQNSFSTSALINERTSGLLKQLLQSTESNSKASIKFQNDESQCSETFALCDLQNNVKTSNFPSIVDILGPYIELNDSIEDKIKNSDLKCIVDLSWRQIIIHC